jgi:hypothetical protein
MKPIAPHRDIRKVTMVQGKVRQSFIIKNIDETRFISNQTMTYLETTFKEAISLIQTSVYDGVFFELKLKPNGDLQILSETPADITPLIKLLADTRDFFSLSKELLKFTEGQTLIFQANANNAGLFDPTINLSAIRDQNNPTNPIVLTNKKIKLRGLIEKPVAPTKEKSKPEEKTPLAKNEAKVADDILYRAVPSQLNRIIDGNKFVSLSNNRIAVLKKVGRGSEFQIYNLADQSFSVFNLPEVFFDTAKIIMLPDDKVLVYGGAVGIYNLNSRKIIRQFNFPAGTKFEAVPGKNGFLTYEGFRDVTYYDLATDSSINVSGGMFNEFPRFFSFPEKDLIVAVTKDVSKATNLATRDLTVGYNVNEENQVILKDNLPFAAGKGQKLFSERSYNINGDLKFINLSVNDNITFGNEIIPSGNGKVGEIPSIETSTDGKLSLRLSNTLKSLVVINNTTQTTQSIDLGDKGSEVKRASFSPDGKFLLVDLALDGVQIVRLQN